MKRKNADINQIAASIVEQVTDPKTEEETTPAKNPNAVALGRLGGLKSGQVRKEKLTKEQRSEIAKKAANARWHKEKK